MWYEEWASWAGVEAHGATEHGAAFHAIVDDFIEEEWTFYQVPSRELPADYDADSLNILPAAGFFNNGSLRQQFAPLRVVHLQTDERAALLSDYARCIGTREDNRGGYAILLESRDVPEQFVLLAEEAEAAAGACWRAEFVQGARSRADLAELAFGPLLWPEDVE